MSEIRAHSFPLNQTPSQKLNGLGLELGAIADEAAEHGDFANAHRMLDLAEQAFEQSEQLTQGE